MGWWALVAWHLHLCFLARCQQLFLLRAVIIRSCWGPATPDPPPPWQCPAALDLQPRFISAELAQEILTAGKTISFLRECCADTEWAAKVPAAAQASIGLRVHAPWVCCWAAGRQRRQWGAVWPRCLAQSCQGARNPLHSPPSTTPLPKPCPSSPHPTQPDPPPVQNKTHRTSPPTAAARGSSCAGWRTWWATSAAASACTSVTSS